jgi:DNA topoisomerase-2
VEKGTIVSYDDLSTETPHYILKFTRQKLAELQEKNRLNFVLKMTEREGENYTTLDEHGKLKIFQSPEEIVEYFVDFRLKYYDKRKQKLLGRLAGEMNDLNVKCRFIQAILDEKLQVNRRKKSEIVADLQAMKFDQEDGSYDHLLRMPIHSLTQEKFDELQAQLKKKQEEHNRTLGTTAKEMYVADLKELLKKLK